MDGTLRDRGLIARRVSLTLLIGMGLQILLNVVFANYLHWGHPWDTFLFGPADRFNDFYHQARIYSADWIRPTTLCIPGMHLNALGFRYTVRVGGETGAFVGCLALFLAIHWSWLWSSLRHAGWDRGLFCVIIAFVNYPILFAIDRGNTEVLVYAANVLIVVAFIKRWYTLSALLIAISINHKPFPIVFLLLFVQKRLWWRISLALGAGGMIFWTCGLHAIALRSPGYIELFTREMSLKFETGPLSSYYGHSFFIPFKLARALIVGNQTYYVNILTFFIIYGVIAALMMAGCGVVFGRYRLQLLDQLLLITTLETALPWTSGDYTLLHTFLPLGLLLRRRRPLPGDRVLALLLAILLIPKHYFWFALTPADTIITLTNLVDPWFGISTSGLIAPIIYLIIFLFIILRVIIKRGSRGRLRDSIAESGSFRLEMAGAAPPGPRRLWRQPRKVGNRQPS